MKHPVPLLITLLGMLASLCHAVVITPQTTRPWFLSGPSDKEDIKARLAIFSYPQSTYIHAYLYGTEAEKQAATTVYFDQLLLDYTTQMGRRLQEDLFEYDVVEALGYVTPVQRQTLLDRTVYYINTTFPTFPATATDFTNLGQEKVCALGLAALNFPDHPDAQIWIDASVRWTGQFIDYYFPDGAGVECQRYHDWSLSLLGKYLFALRRCTDADLFGRPGIRHALDWMIRFTSPPLSVGSEPYTLPAWGDSNYGSLYYHLPVFANAFKDSDPDFSRRLMHWWRKTGSQVNSGWEFGTAYPQIFDPRLPDSPVAPVNTSTYSPYMGHAILRDDTDGVDGLFATFNCGYGSLSHFEADNGHLDLFAFGVPVALDSMGGTYDASAFTWNRQTMAHNTVRCVMPEYGTALRTVSGVFQAFGASDIADYTVGNTSYGQTSVRHVVMVKGDYMVVWDQITAASYSDWFFHTPADTTRPDGGLEWQANKVISHTPWDVDLDIHFLLPANSLPAPTVATDNISIDYTTTGAMASEHPVPTTAKLYTGQGKGRFGDWTNPADPAGDPWNLKWLTYMVVRAPSADGDYLTVLHPRKVGVTPTLTTTLTSSTATSVSLTVDYNGRTDTIAINTSGATVTKGGYPTVQFSKTYPQSGVSGAARYVKADDSITTLSTALTTTGTVDVSLGTLELGGNDRIPNTVPVVVRSGGTLNVKNRNDTVGKLAMDGGTLTGTSGTLTVSGIDWYGGTVSANVMCTGAFTKKGGAPWSPSAFINYSGDTMIEDGTLLFQTAGPNPSGTGKVILSSGSILDLNDTNRSFAPGNLAAAAGSSITTGTGTLTLTGGSTGTIDGTFTGNLVHTGTALATFNGAFGEGTTLAVQSGATLGLGSQSGAVLTAATGSTVALNGVFTAGSGSTVSGAVTGTGSLVAATGTTLTLAATTTLGATVCLGINGTGKLNIPSGTTLTAPCLTIDGILQAAGTYTSPTLISGGGSLVLTNGVNVPADLSVSTTTGSAVLGWIGAAGATSYRIKRAATSGGPYTLIGTVTSPFYTDNSAISGTVYYVVSAANVYGETMDSAEVQAYLIHGATLTAAVASGARIWLDAARDDSFIQSGGAVSRWNDARGNGNYFAQGTGSSQPTWHDDATLAGPATTVVDFGSYYFDTSTGRWMQANAEIADVRTVFWVGKSSMENHLLGNTATYDFHTGGTSLWSTSYTSDSIRGGTTWLNGSVINGTSTALPAAYARIGVVTTGNVRVNTLALDRTYRSGGMRIGEVILFNSVLDSTQRQNVEAYLAYKWSGSGTGIGNLISAQALAIGGGGVLDISGENFQTLDALSATDNSGAKIRLGAARLTVGDSSSTVFDGIITGTGGSLVKVGAGSLTLAGANSFTGGTTVNSGTLVVGTTGTLGTGSLTVAGGAACDLHNTGGAIADPADVHLTTTSSTLILASGVTETVARLYLDGSLQAPGTWNAARDPAHFSGSGSLIVTDGLLLPPTALAAASDSVSAITLSWVDNATNETGYRVERSLTASSGFSEIATLGAGATAYTNNGLSPGTTYYYRVRAVNASDNSTYSGEASATTRPTAPEGLTAMAGDMAVRLSWTAAAGVTAYQVKRSASAGGPYTVVGTPAANLFINTGLTNGTAYYYVVSSVGAAGESADSAEAAATPLPSVAYSWTGMADGNWSAAGNWLANQVAVGTNNTATFNQATGVTVTNDVADNTIGHLVFATSDYTIQGGGLTLEAANAAPSISVGASRTTTISSTLNGNHGLNKSGAGTLLLSGTNTLTGTVTVDAGTLALAGGAALADTVAVALTNTAGTELLLNASETIGSLAGGGASGGTVNLGASTLTVGDASSTSYAGLISGVGGSLKKIGSGTLSLGANNSYTGSTILDGGALKYTVNNTGVKGLFFGASSGSSNVSALDLSLANLTATGLTVRTNSTGINNITIGSGKTLTVNGGFSMDTAIGGTANLTVGGAGALSINSPASTFLVGATSDANTRNCNLDMSGLGGGFTANVANFYVGRTVNTYNNVPNTTVKLAPGSSITATNFEVGSDATSNGGNGGGQSVTVTLTGGTNYVKAGSVTVGRIKSGTQTLHFAPVGGGSIILSGTNGTSALGTMYIGYKPHTGSNNDVTGVADFTHGAVTGNITTLYVGHMTSSQGSGSPKVFGTLTLGASAGNNLTVNTLNIGTFTGSTVPTSTKYPDGSVTVNGGALTAGSVAMSSEPYGRADLNVPGGTVMVNGNITAGNSTYTAITLNGGTLDMTHGSIGSAANPIGTLNFQTGTLKNVASINGTGSVAKTTTGTLTLQGNNGYTGGTTVTSGTLVADTDGTLGSGNLTVNAAAICELRNTGGAVADTATVYLTGSGRLVLAAGVSESVSKLYIDGVLAKSGKWNASRDPIHFSGSGELVVTDGEPLTPAEAWRQDKFGSIEDAGGSADGADPDKDGSVNLIERALGMNPNGPDSGHLPAIDATQAAFAFTFTKSRTATDLTIVVEESSALSPGSWTTAGGTMELIDDSNAGFQRFRYTPTPGPGTRKFYHLWVRP